MTSQAHPSPLSGEIINIMKLCTLYMGITVLNIVDVFVTLEDILMYIIIVCCCTPIGDVCYLFTGCLNCVKTLRYNLDCKLGQ